MQRQHILLVDDNQLFRASTRELLEHLGHRVVEAGDGYEAEARIRGASFDILITDVLMPDRDGLELLRWLRTGSTEARVIVVSGGGKADAEFYLRLASKYPSVKACLKKPFSLSELRDALMSALDS